MSDERQTVLVTITGRVQGVWFRDWTKRQAVRLGLFGWVRNRSDNSVEALFHGESGAIEQMIEKCRSGSPLSRVDDVAVVDQPDYEGEGFEIRATG